MSHPLRILILEGNPADNTGITEKKAIERQLLRAQRMESIGTLASGVAHDLNNILAPILMAAPLLHEELPPDMRDRLVSTIEESAQRAADIVEQLLTFARGVEGERLPLQPAQLIRDTLKIIRETFPKTIEVSARLDENLRMITGDSTLMHQVLLNLCVNAREAMANGGQLTISAENFDMNEQHSGMMLASQPGPYVMISITDDGVGIPAHIIDKIFDPFFTTKAHGKGAGLGLSTALGILKSHQGLVSVSSQTGQGTTFNLFLPASSEPTSEAMVAMGRDSSTFGKGELILIVDDEAGIREVTETMLSRNGYQVIVAADGAEAVVLYAQRQHEIALVLTDIIMPYFDGVALAHALRKINPNVKIVASTGQQEDSMRTSLPPSYVQALLAKPYSRNELLATIHRVLSSPLEATQ